MVRSRLHCVGASGNWFKVALFLNCAGIDWEPVGVDFAGGVTRDHDWRAAVNAMGESQCSKSVVDVLVALPHTGFCTP
ncbi:hypothetical protein [Bradyrhizobium sp. Gha]|uniref:hypothetical protein n=1 Tax=Bradyrhizobium sp. Gha TaxID=1855318 RepID=UPI0008E86371|nr:hypothetical protein [Bradyrhizobium sp. Gha]SFI69663.1 glutathione S-transferase [Bradyrhizobium sp. Gha]